MGFHYSFSSDYPWNNEWGLEMVKRTLNNVHSTKEVLVIGAEEKACLLVKNIRIASINNRGLRRENALQLHPHKRKTFLPGRSVD